MQRSTRTTSSSEVREGMTDLVTSWRFADSIIEQNILSCRHAGENMRFEGDQDFILRCLRSQDAGEPLSAHDHNKLIGLLDRELVGMDGFRYMWPEQAKENRRRFLASQGRQF
jgi:hypothetical protein